MYTDEDLYLAVKQGIFEKNAVDRFRESIARESASSIVDEENFRLLSGFNDIFVSIAAFLLLWSLGWWCREVLGSTASFLTVAMLSWLLSLHFVKRKRLALPAIIFLFSFLIGIIGCVTDMLEPYGGYLALYGAFGTGALGAWIHWMVFRVPVTIAAGVASLVVPVLILAEDRGLLIPVMLLCGLLAFGMAMFWDSRDTERKTRKSDIAFWLHLLAAPLIVHPVFMALDILDGRNDIPGIIVIVYILLGVVSIVIDRRALMVSSLVYVIYALQQLFLSYGMVSSSAAISGIIIGSSLLLLSVFWQQSRMCLLRLTSASCRKYLPD